MKFIVLMIGFMVLETSMAATFCVTSETELRNALAIAENNNSFDTIRIQTGNYLTQGNQFEFDDDSGNGLELIGGWTYIPNIGNCGGQLSSNVFDTTIDGSSLSAAMSIELSDAADLSISNLTFANAISNDAALSIRKYNSNGVYLGHYIIENNAFINNQSGGFYGSALYIRGADTIEVRNNLVYQNLGATQSINIENGLGVEIYFTNNTIYQNEGRVWIELDGTSEMLIANNVIRDNDSFSELSVSGTGDWYFYNNNTGFFYSEPNTASKNFNLPPRFIDSNNLDFRPNTDSPLIDKGFLPCLYTAQFCIFPMPFIHDWELVDKDIVGNDRIQNSKVEIGAVEVSYESDVIFMNLFE
jgi:hypothetical protein